MHVECGVCVNGGKAKMGTSLKCIIDYISASEEQIHGKSRDSEPTDYANLNSQYNSPVCYVLIRIRMPDNESCLFTG